MMKPENFCIFRYASIGEIIESEHEIPGRMVPLFWPIYLGEIAVPLDHCSSFHRKGRNGHSLTLVSDPRQTSAPPPTRSDLAIATVADPYFPVDQLPPWVWRGALKTYTWIGYCRWWKCVWRRHHFGVFFNPYELVTLQCRTLRETYLLLETQAPKQLRDATIPIFCSAL